MKIRFVGIELLDAGWRADRQIVKLALQT